VHVVATTGGIVEPAELTAPGNAWLTPFANHEQLLERAAVVVGHGGHGTTMRALLRSRGPLPARKGASDWDAAGGGKCTPGPAVTGR
jgi:hypothetical protein